MHIYIFAAPYIHVNMANEVIIIHGDDGTVWTNYLDEQLTNCNTVNAKTFMQLDQNLFTSSAIDSRAETRILKADVVLVIITPGHMEYMFKNKRASYKHLVPTGVNGLMLFVGITEEEIIQPEHWTQTREKFPHYDKWGKVHYVDENSIKDLLEKIVEIMENTPENTQTNFSVIPTTLQCEVLKCIILSNRLIMCWRSLLLHTSAWGGSLQSFEHWNENMVDDMHMALVSVRYGFMPARVFKSGYKPLGEC